MKHTSLLALLGASCSLLIDGIAAPVCSETRCDVANELLLLQCESNDDNTGVINRIDCSTPDEGQTLCQDDLSIDGSAENTISGCTICGDGLLDLDSFEACDDGDNNNNNNSNGIVSNANVEAVLSQAHAPLHANANLLNANNTNANNANNANLLNANANNVQVVSQSGMHPIILCYL